MTLTILAVVTANVDWALIETRMREGRPIYGVAAVLCVAGALIIGGVRWGLLLRTAGAPVSRRELYRIYAVASFATAFLPSAVGGDVARPFMVSRRGPRLIRAMATVLLERALALAPLIGLAWLGVLLDAPLIGGGSIAALGVASGAIAVGLTLALLQRQRVRQLARSILPRRAVPHLSEAQAAVVTVVRSRRTMAVALVQSTAFQVLVTLQVVFLAQMLRVDLPFGVAAVALALVTLAMLVPVSIGGFGVREGSYVVVLAGAGVSHTDALLISLLSVVALFIATLPGAVELVRRGFDVAAPHQGEL